MRSSEMDLKFECQHTTLKGNDAVQLVRFEERDKVTGEMEWVNDYAYCPLCGKRFCVSP